MIHPVVGLEVLSEDLEGIQLDDLPLDEPIPRERIPATANRHKQFFDQILQPDRRGAPDTAPALSALWRGARWRGGARHRRRRSPTTWKHGSSAMRRTVSC